MRRVPVLGEDDVGEFFGEGVDEGDDGVAVFDFEGAAWTEVVLEVDDEQRVVGLELHGCLMVVQSASNGVVLLHPSEQVRSSGTPVRTMPKSQNRDMGHPDS